MAKYAISAEGAASMRALAKQLYTEANAILESSAALEAKYLPLAKDWVFTSQKS